MMYLLYYLRVDAGFNVDPYPIGVVMWYKINGLLESGEIPLACLINYDGVGNNYT